MVTKKNTGRKKRTTERMLHMIMDEIVDVRNELKEEISDVRNELGGRIDTLAQDVRSLRLEVHQNHLTFMKNHDDFEKRVTTLEATCA